MGAPVVEIANFQPSPGTAPRMKALNPSGTSQHIALNPDAYSGSSLYVYNASDHDVAIALGATGLAAVLPTTGTAGDFVIPAGGTVILDCSPAIDPAPFAAIIASGAATGNVYFALGMGN